MNVAAVFVASTAQTANEEEHPIRVSHAEITLKSATLPRRKLSHGEPESHQVTAPTPKMDHSSRFHPELRKTSLGNAYSPVYSQTAARAASLEPQQIVRPKEHFIPIQGPGGSYIAGAGISSPQQSIGSQLSRQSTVESDISDTQTNTTQSTMSGAAISTSSQPIKKSPREFIIPIAVEGGGYVTPRAGSLEPSDSNNSTGIAFRRLGNRRKKFR